MAAGGEKRDRLPQTTPGVLSRVLQPNHALTLRRPADKALPRTTGLNLLVSFRRFRFVHIPLGDAGLRSGRRGGMLDPSGPGVE